jgi:hypothetical protein
MFPTPELVSSERLPAGMNPQNLLALRNFEKWALAEIVVNNKQNYQNSSR